MNHSSFYAGTSGLLLPVKNKQFYPPEFQERSRLEYYASLFNSIEINSSFYKIPQAKTVQKWAESMPEGFQFTFKLWKEITHTKELSVNVEAISRFMEVIGYAGTKKGSLLIQFPPSVTIASEYKLQGILDAVRRNDPAKEWKVAVEMRHSSWYEPEIYDLLEDRGIALVLQDMPSSVTPMTDSTVDFAYLRFHGPGGSYRGTYADDFLSEYASYIRDWLNEGKTVYCYFNNTMGDAIRNLETLRRYVEA